MIDTDEEKGKQQPQQQAMTGRDYLVIALLIALIHITFSISNDAALTNEAVKLVGTIGFYGACGFLLGYLVSLGARLFHQQTRMIQAARNEILDALDHLRFDTAVRDDDNGATLDRVEQAVTDLHASYNRNSLSLNTFVTTQVKNALVGEDTNGHYHTLSGATAPSLDAVTLDSLPSTTPRAGQAGRRTGERGSKRANARADAQRRDALPLSANSDADAGAGTGAGPTTTTPPVEAAHNLE